MIKKLVAQLIDEMAVLACSGVGIIIFNLALKIFGYQVSDYLPVLFIIFVIFNILYYPVLESSKLKGTLGRKFLNLYQDEDIELVNEKISTEEVKVKEVKDVE